jgi:hypothetical protein
MGRTITSFNQEFDRLFTEFRHTAFRLETLQWYNVAYEEEPIRRFLAGERNPDDPSTREWLGMVRSAHAAGKQMQRVHIIIEPPSDYVRFELNWLYQDNVVSGEDVRILSVGQNQWPDDLPKHDYWLFDSRQLVIMSYDHDGAFLAAEFVEDPSEIVQHNYWRDVALHQAIAYGEYMSKSSEVRV